MGWFDILKQAREKKVKEFVEADLLVPELESGIRGNEELFRPPYWIIGTWRNAEMEVTFTFTENDGIHTRAKRKSTMLLSLKTSLSMRLVKRPLILPILFGFPKMAMTL